MPRSFTKWSWGASRVFQKNPEKSGNASKCKCWVNQLPSETRKNINIYLQSTLRAESSSIFLSRKIEEDSARRVSSERQLAVKWEDTKIKNKFKIYLTFSIKSLIVFLRTGPIPGSLGGLPLSSSASICTVAMLLCIHHSSCLHTHHSWMIHSGLHIHNSEVHLDHGTHHNEHHDKRSYANQVGSHASSSMRRRVKQQNDKITHWSDKKKSNSGV